MNVLEAIETRRAYRSLAPVDITPDLLRDLARCAQLAPSCNNNQPWRFVFIHGKENLERFHPVLSSPGNDWAKAASLIVAVCSRKEDDCLIKDREYHLFGDGLAAAFLILRATELGLVAHPIAGYRPKKAREILGIPEDDQVITLINIGKRAAEISPVLSPKQVEQESTRPERKPLSEFAFDNRFGAPLAGESGR
ncbi:MAG: nitroreductase family protein [Candidatus Aminicenantes bacterium]|nr:nitroreductase family protein [Candidatus Aminicenantes bacterium]